MWILYPESISVRLCVRPHGSMTLWGRREAFSRFSSAMHIFHSAQREGSIAKFNELVISSSQADSANNFSHSQFVFFFSSLCLLMERQPVAKRRWICDRNFLIGFQWGEGACSARFQRGFLFAALSRSLWLPSVTICEALQTSLWARSLCLYVLNSLFLCGSFSSAFIQPHKCLISSATELSARQKINENPPGVNKVSRIVWRARVKFAGGWEKSLSESVWYSVLLIFWMLRAKKCNPTARAFSHPSL